MNTPTFEKRCILNTMPVALERDWKSQTQSVKQNTVCISTAGRLKQIQKTWIQSVNQKSVYTGQRLAVGNRVKKINTPTFEKWCIPISVPAALETEGYTQNVKMSKYRHQNTPTHSPSYSFWRRERGESHTQNSMPSDDILQNRPPKCPLIGGSDNSLSNRPMANPAEIPAIKHTINVLLKFGVKIRLRTPSNGRFHHHHKWVNPEYAGSVTALVSAINRWWWRLRDCGRSGQEMVARLPCPESLSRIGSTHESGHGVLHGVDWLAVDWWSGRLRSFGQSDGVGDEITKRTIR